MRDAMTTAELDAPAASPSDIRAVGTVSLAHFVSHYFILLLAPLFIFVRADFQVSYTELGLALTAFNVVTAALQTPAGFLVDRIGPRAVLVAGLTLGSVAFAIAGFVSSYWIFVAMFALAGLGNTVYHPADYAILAKHVSARRMSQAFSVHAFAGMLGSAAAPGSLLLLQSFVGWRGAFGAAACLGLAAAALIALQREPWPEFASREPDKRGGSAAQPLPHTKDGWSLLLSGPVLRNLLFFLLIAITNGGLQNYTVVTLGALYQTPPAAANIALSGFLLLTALGVLAGGFLAARTDRHGLVATIGLLSPWRGRS